MSKIKTYFKELPKRYFITAFSGMAQGLFCTLIAGTILSTIAKNVLIDVFNFNNYFTLTLNVLASLSKSLMGAGIGIGIAHALGKNKMIIFSSAIAGMIGAFADKLIVGGSGLTAISLGVPGNPIGSYVVTMISIEICSLYAGKTKLDILLVPLGIMLLSFIGVFVAYPFIYLVNELGVLIALATKVTPFFMGIIIAVLMGILLTLPTSSAAIWIAVAKSVIESGGDKADYMLIAGGAATVGCACHMVGFAVASFRENKWSGIVSQGVGTSMLQIPNLMKKPIIMLPMIISSAILGPISTCVFKLKCSFNGGGMGTSGFVGIIDLLTNTKGVLGIIGIFLLMIILPAILNILISEFMRKKGWIQFGDMKLPD